VSRYEIYLAGGKALAIELDGDAPAVAEHVAEMMREGSVTEETTAAGQPVVISWTHVTALVLLP
jgi:hypothetical protein